MEGAAAGAEASLYILAAGGDGTSEAPGEVILVILAAGPAIGALVGIAQDLGELWARIECDWTPGIAWDCEEGRRLRRIGSYP